MQSDYPRPSRMHTLILFQVMHSKCSLFICWKVVQEGVAAQQRRGGRSAAQGWRRRSLPRSCCTTGAVMLITLITPGTEQCAEPPDLLVTPPRPLPSPLLRAEVSVLLVCYFDANNIV